MQVKDEEIPSRISRRARLMQRFRSIRKTVAAVFLCMVLFVSGFLMGLHGRSAPSTSMGQTYTGIYRAPSDQAADKPVVADTTPKTPAASQPGSVAATPAIAPEQSGGSKTAAPASVAVPPPPTPEEVLAGIRWPTEGAVVRGPGWLYSLTLEHWVYLPGVDIGAADGSTVTASLKGVVKSISTEPVLGNVVVLEHEGGVTTTYGRLAAVALVLGDKVDPGDAIGTSGPDALYFAAFSGVDALDAQACLAKAR